MKTDSESTRLAFIFNSSADWNIGRITILFITCVLSSFKKEIYDYVKFGLPIKLFFDYYEVPGSVSWGRGSVGKNMFQGMNGRVCVGGNLAFSRNV